MRLAVALAIIFFISCVAAQTFKDECGCYNPGTVNNMCDSNRVCNCKPNFGSDKCDECSEGHYWFPKCLKGCGSGRQCKFIAAGFASYELYPEAYLFGEIHPYAYRFSGPGESSDVCYNNRLDLDRFTTQVGYRNIIGGMINNECYIMAYPAVGPAIGYTISSEQGPIDIEEPDPVGVNITIVAQTNFYGLIGFTDQFSVYSLSSGSYFWEVLKEFPSEEDKNREWGNILCATAVSGSEVAVVTTGPNSRTLTFNLEDDEFIDGPAPGGVTGEEGACTMLDEENIFIVSDRTSMVYNVRNGTRIENYFEQNDLPRNVGSPNIMKGDFGHVLIGGSTDDVFYLPEGTRSWIRSGQKLGTTGLYRTIGCLFNI